MPKLLIKTGEKKGLVFRITTGEFLVGRDFSNDVVLPDPRVSRVHARLICDGPQCEIEDKNSVNGTAINGKKVDRQHLKPGDEITLGSTKISFLAMSAPERIDSLGESVMFTAGDENTMAQSLPSSDGFLVGSNPALDKKLAEINDDALEKAFQRLTTLYQVSYDLRSVVELPRMLDRVLELALNITEADRGFIMLRDEESQNMVLQAVRRKDGVKEDEDLSVSKTILDQVVETGEAVLTTDTEHDPRFHNAESIMIHHIRSAMCVPLKVKDKVLGILNVDTQGAVCKFTKDDLDLLSAMAVQAAVAIENAQLFDGMARANKTLKEKQAQLIEAEKLSALGQLASGVAHEINNPLACILGYSELCAKLLSQDELNEKVLKECQEFVTVINNESLRCRDIVRSLLQYARRKKSELTETDINSVVETSLTIAQFHIKKVSIEIKVQLADDLPIVMAEANQLQQVFLNMVINARDAMANGGTLTISTEKEAEKWVVIKFADTGCGIPEDKRGEIFKPLFTTKEEGKGTGLGLSITQDIVDRHHGSIDLESEIGKGTTFIIKLPVAEKKA